MAMISVTTESAALTSFGIDASARPIRPACRSIIAHRRGGGLIRALWLAAQGPLQVPGVIAVEEMAAKTPVQVGGAKQPIGDRERQVHVAFHHQPGIVMGGMMAAQRVDKWTMAHEPVLV